MNQTEKDGAIHLTEAELRKIIKETVHDTMITMGMQDADPIEMQKDFQLLREWRKSTDEIKRKGILGLLTLICAGVISLIVIGIKSYLN
jgi:hypothetical protein